MESCKVSIIVPVYNGEKYIRSCIRGLLRQTYQNIECILVDDGSTDDSGKICDCCAEKSPKVKVVHRKNGGISAARNSGTKIAEGKYVFYFDVDDTVTDSVVEDNVRMAEENQADVVFFCFWYFIVDKNKKIPNGMAQPFIGDRESYFYEMLIPTIKNETFNAPWNKMYSREFLYKSHLHFDEKCSTYEDIIFASKMLQYAEKIVINNRKYYTYYLWPSGSALTRYTDGYFKSVTKFYVNAMDYCNMFDDNINQKRRFSLLYLRLTMTNLKQISCHDKMDLAHKYELIQHICENRNIQMAVRMVNYNSRKELVRKLIEKKKYREIYAIYRITGFVQRK